MSVTDPETITYSALGRQGTTEVWANVFHVLNVTGGPFDLALATQIDGAFFAFFQAIDTFMHDQWFFDMGKVEQETSGTVFEFAHAVTGPNLNPLPFDQAVVVSWGGTPNTRSTRGRNYICGWDEDHNDDGVLSVAAQTALLAAAEDLGNDLAAQDTPLVVWSEKNSLSSLVTRVRVGRRYDTQRRRQNKIAESYLTATLA